MKLMRIIFSIVVVLIINTNCLGQTTNDSLTIKYINRPYNFTSSVPASWTIYREIKNDSLNNFAFIDWGLPKVYSEIEKTEIENSISIKAFRSGSIKSQSDLELNEYLRIDPTKTALELEDGISPDSRIIYHNHNGIEYKGKCYFIYTPKTCYIITFMATPGTYDKNLQVFEDFYDGFKIE